jgi:hypothetical protein
MQAIYEQSDNKVPNYFSNSPQPQIWVPHISPLLARCGKSNYSPTDLRRGHPDILRFSPSTSHSSLSHASPLVIPQRSGGICSFSPSHSQVQPKSPLSPCHPDRSEAKWRDLQCAPRLSQILPGKRPGCAIRSKSTLPPRTGPINHHPNRTWTALKPQRKASATLSATRDSDQQTPLSVRE